MKTFLGIVEILGKQWRYILTQPTAQIITIFFSKNLEDGNIYSIQTMIYGTTVAISQGHHPQVLQAVVRRYASIDHHMLAMFCSTL